MKIVDLSWLYSWDEMLVFPGNDPPVFKKDGCVNKGDALELSTIDNFCVHYGTHLDCSGHMIPNGYYCQDRDPGFWVGKGIVVDCSKYPEGSEIGMDAVENVEISDKEFVLFYINWSADRWDTPEQYGKYPVLSLGLANYLRKHPVVRGVAVESVGIDAVGDKSYRIHKEFLKDHNKTIIEGVTNMDQLLGKDFIFMALPLNLKDCDGSPTRAVALLMDE